jgi:hypothetical protein
MRAAPRDQHDRLWTWQTIAVPAASAGEGNYVLQSRFVTPLEIFFTSTARLLETAPSGRRLPAVEWNATNDQQGRNEACLVMAINHDHALQLIAIADPLRSRPLP